MNEIEVVAVVYSELLKVAGGIVVILGALSAFLGRVWINHIANRETQAREEKLAEFRAMFEKQNAELKAKLDVGLQRTVFVDKLQFEHEYTIYKQAWELLDALRQATLRLRPRIDSVDPNESKEELMKRRIGAFVEPFNAYRDVIEKSKPFYSENVYSALSDVLTRCHTEVIDYEYTEQPHKEYWAEARKNHEAILKAIDAACQSIRTRIAEVRVAWI